MKNTFILIGAALLVAVKAYSYGTNGHYLVGAVADQMLNNTATSQKVKALIGNVTLAQAALMPDAIKNWDPTGSKYGKPFKVTTNGKLNGQLHDFLLANQTIPDCTRELLHHEFHFADIEVLSASPQYSDHQVGASDHDIIHMIGYCIDVLTGKTSEQNPYKITKGVALVLLAHYVGDIHQPLHVGAEYFDDTGKVIDPNSAQDAAADKGGNSFTIAIPKENGTGIMKNKNLHGYWDDDAVADAIKAWAQQTGSANKDDIAIFLKKLPTGWLQEPTINPDTFATECADEILPIAHEAHSKLTFTKVVSRPGECIQVKSGVATPSAKYRDYAAKTVSDEIHKAGHRLADLLEVILK